MTRYNSTILSESLKVYFIMGSMNCRKTPEEVLSEAIAGGITMFQFREKGPESLIGEARFDLAKRLQQICRLNSVPFIVNDDIDLAIALDADGIHVGQDDQPARSIREQIGENKIVGVSAHTLKEAQQAIADGADYLGIGPIYPTTSKDDAKEVQGTKIIEELRENGLTIPLVGIGGITLTNAIPVITAGADGISVISAIAAADDISGTVGNFVRVVREHILELRRLEA
ncbi:thiamine phosphate synthase [Paenibacillus wynnii]|uniref:thiamine phosphate synthase n=1 Tax=Paenibacillus wynnii TaxID=268407 RepID=UPI002793FC28|nr:thiamine phosphate synthase [Paenibacillus wynnii]MDQ0195584.1 thiamine-phosphate pyrophosphorylase [Paenibacillus wynnii]